MADQQVKNPLVDANTQVETPSIPLNGKRLLGATASSGGAPIWVELWVRLHGREPVRLTGGLVMTERPVSWVGDLPIGKEDVLVAVVTNGTLARRTVDLAAVVA